MSMHPNKIRCLALAIINHDGKTLVSPGYDTIKKTDFYRLVGGGIEFGEDSLSTLKREIREELGTELLDCKLLGIQENIFEFNGNPGHEICFVYQVTLANQELYHQQSVQIINEPEHRAVWVKLNPENISKIKPEGFVKYFS